MLDQASKADSYELVEEKETPATKHSRPQKRKPNARLSRTRLKRRRAPSKLTTPPTPRAGEREPTENPNRLTDPPPGRDGWNQSEVKIAQAKPGNGPQRNDYRVGGVLSVSYHSCSGKDPQLSKGPPTARITVANPPFTQWIAPILFQSTKCEMGEKERGLY